MSPVVELLVDVSVEPSGTFASLTLESKSGGTSASPKPPSKGATELSVSSVSLLVDGVSEESEVDGDVSVAGSLVAVVPEDSVLLTPASGVGSNVGPSSSPQPLSRAAPRVNTWNAFGRRIGMLSVLEVPFARHADSFLQ
jgi:hypothetical protein